MFPKASKKQFDSLLCYEVPAVKDTNLKAKHNYMNLLATFMSAVSNDSKILI